MNEKLHNFYSSPNLFMIVKSKRLRRAGHVASMEDGRSVFKILSGKPIGKISLGNPRRRCEDKIRMDLKQIGINTMNWVDLAQNRDYRRVIENAALNFRVL